MPQIIRTAINVYKSSPGFVGFIDIGFTQLILMARPKNRRAARRVTIEFTMTEEIRVEKRWYPLVNIQKTSKNMENHHIIAG
jgi:hypothetical protein